MKQLLIVFSLIVLSSCSYLDLVEKTVNYNNLRPCIYGSNATYNTLGSQNSYVDTCLSQGKDVVVCEQAWTLFSNVLNSTTLPMQSGSWANYSPYLDYFDWRSDIQEHNRIPIFYANTGMCPDIIHRITNYTGVREITLEDQTGVRSVANHVWCDESQFVSRNGTCMNETVWGQNPNFACPSCGYNGAAFWLPASIKFAEISFGIPKVMIRGFCGIECRVAYANDSVFAAFELPALQSNPDITGLDVVVVSNHDMSHETCGSGTVMELQQLIRSTVNSNTNKTWTESCVVDPPCVLRVICETEENVNVTLSNEKTKCDYFRRFWTGSQFLPCDCTTAYFDNENTFPNECPGVKEHLYDSSAMGKADSAVVMILAVVLLALAL